jgi:hypothetical protein
MREYSVWAMIGYALSLHKPLAFQGKKRDKTVRKNNDSIQRYI